jgi:hypothetical protein
MDTPDRGEERGWRFELGRVSAGDEGVVLPVLLAGAPQEGLHQHGGVHALLAEGAPGHGLQAPEEPVDGGVAEPCTCQDGPPQVAGEGASRPPGREGHEAAFTGRIATSTAVTVTAPTPATAARSFEVAAHG